ncbi:hypothetical protein [Phaeobacter inhibens]|uniref:hypothetical protein n=1 Tax=Phaeobacter inhibens TaxID=221822 RepID=UPI000971B738|nr:hypothetical protein [Phaeobacter inhibens]APX17688.1 hypothetical protein BWR17_12365 [Phaeobacter inhibens]UWR40096.1 hypothetical protein K4F85_11630 [Phaeobacter inhibens]UWR49259.1 hypothetical protein K4F87_00475 [Phaeobacter inhibens]UWR60846.1 hypothetical protein K4F88_00475 [Phaeobacter inhibens]UWR84580.1 hypothetical protein K4L05_00440 [Phaeobacter inhibens]
MKKALIVFSLLGATACAIPATPIVADYNGDSVTIVTSQFSERASALAASTKEAERICQKGHKKRAEHVSVRANSNTYENSDLFLCLK